MEEPHEDAVWRALAHRTRREMLDVLRERPQSTGELVAALGQNRHAVLQHLTVLRDADLVLVVAQGRRRINHLNAVPIAAVWAELTKLGPVQRAMMDTVLESTLEVGAPLYYKSRDGTRVFIVGRIVEIEPPNRLAHSQRLTTRDDPFTLVTWSLEETDDGTSVTLLHTGWPDDTPKLDQVDNTWAMILPELKQVVETGDISTGLKLRYGFMRAFMWAMPARTRTENVPEPDATPRSHDA